MSSSSTSACMPSAIAAAFRPATPAPMTTTFAAYTPDTPASRMPRPPPARIRWYAPTCGASRPATSDIGASSGNDRSGSSTVSYAIPVTFASSNAFVHSGDAARCRYVNSTCPSRIRWYSSAIGSFTLRIRSAVPHTSSAVGRIVAPAETNSGSAIAEPAPAPDSTRTSWPLRANSCTPAGVMATRYSLFLTSRGIPTFTLQTPLSARPRPAAPLPPAVDAGRARSLERRAGPSRVHHANQSAAGLTWCQPASWTAVAATAWATAAANSRSSVSSRSDGWW